VWRADACSGGGPKTRTTARPARPRGLLVKGEFLYRLLAGPRQELREGHIEENGIDDPAVTRELIVIRRLSLEEAALEGRAKGPIVRETRTAFIRNDSWLVQGTIKHKHLTLFKDE
jgi:hypothetical protein